MRKKNMFTLIKWITAIYSIGYIVFGYNNDYFLMRAITGAMLGIFSVNLLIYLLKANEGKGKIKTKTLS